MVRPERPLPPRVSAPDLPQELEDGRGQSRDDHFGLRIPLAEDLVHARFEQCLLTGAADHVDLTGSTLLDVDIVDARTAVLSLKNATIRRLRLSGGRIGTLDLSGAHVTELILEHARIDYLSLAGAKVQDSLVADCTLATVDLPAAAATRVRFEHCREVDTRGLRADALDLRGLDAVSFLDVKALKGATLTPRQIELLAPEFARSAGINVQD